MPNKVVVVVDLGTNESDINFSFLQKYYSYQCILIKYSLSLPLNYFKKTMRHKGAFQYWTLLYAVNIGCTSTCKDSFTLWLFSLHEKMLYWFIAIAVWSPQPNWTWESCTGALNKNPNFIRCSIHFSSHRLLGML